MNEPKFKVGDLVRDRSTGDDDSFEFVVEAIEEQTELNKHFCKAMNHPEWADDPLLVNHTRMVALPQGAVELVKSKELH